MLAARHVIEERGEVARVELEGFGKLLRELPDTLDVLHEDGRHLLIRGRVVAALEGRERAAAQRELVAEGEPLLDEQLLEASDGAVVRVEHQLRERGHLRRAIPAVRAVHEHRGAVDRDHLDHRRRGANDLQDVAHPTALVEVAQEGILLLVQLASLGCVERLRLQQLKEGFERRAHHMNVLDAHKRELRVDVLRLMLVPLALRGVELRVHTWPAIDDLQPLVERVRVGDGLEQRLVLRRAHLGHAHARLRRAADGRDAKRVLPAQHGHASSRAELSGLV